MSCSRCGCSPCLCDPCAPSVCTTGCPIQLDFSCVIYHKNNNEVSELDGLNLSNGATLELVVETLDEKIKQVNVLDVSLTYLRSKYVINTLKQFEAAVDTELPLLKVWLGNLTADPTANDGAYWYRTDLDELHIKLNGSTRVITIV